MESWQAGLQGLLTLIIEVFKVKIYSTINPAIAHSIASDPRLNADYTLQADSPCKGAGVNVGVTTDYAGTTRANPPSIGAYEG